LDGHLAIERVVRLAVGSGSMLAAKWVDEKAGGKVDLWVS
jgi:hypothetical protein